MQVILWFLDKFFLILSLLIAVIIHEYSHGRIAEKLGDPTARDAGRLTFNPIVHIDLIGTIIVPIAILIMSGGTATIGWAKPVPVNPYNLNDPQKDMAKVAVAGPVSNFLMAAGAALLLRLGGILPSDIVFDVLIGRTLSINPFLSFLAYLIFINLILGIFNLIPIPPLDGSKILQASLPRELSWRYKKLEPYGLLIVLILFFFFDGFSRIILPLVNLILRLFSVH